MSTTDKRIEEIHKAASNLAAHPASELVSRPEWGALNFSSIRIDLENVEWFCKQLLSLPLESLPASVTDNALGALTQLEDCQKQIVDFDIQIQGATERRESIANSYSANADSLVQTAGPWLLFLSHFKADAVADANRRLGEAVELMKSTQSFADETRKELGEITEAARTAAASVGVESHSGTFEQAANDADALGKRWLIATAVFAGTTLFSAIGSALLPIAADATAAHLLQAFSSRIIALGLLITGTLWCGRLYKAARHQSVLNRHRANALKTFQTFVKSTSDDQTKNAVLLETTRSIYALAPSGLLDAEPSVDSSMKLLEVVRTAGQASKAA